MSSIAIGFDRSLRLDWLDLLAGMAAEGVPVGEARTRLRSRLEGQITGRAALAKTVLVAQRVWYPTQPSHRRLRDSAIALIQTVAPHDRLAIQWGMVIAAYPYFNDCAAIMGRLLRLQSSFTAVQMRRRLIERYGDRAIVARAGRYTVQSCVQWGVLTMVSRRGVYGRAVGLSIASLDVQRFLLEALMVASESAELSLTTVLESPELFPFTFTHDVASAALAPQFTVSTVAGDRRVVSLRG